MPFSPPCIFPGKRAGKGRFSGVFYPIEGRKIFLFHSDSTFFEGQIHPAKLPVFREAACGKALAALWSPVAAPPAVGRKSGYFPGCCTSCPVSVKRKGPKRKTRLFLPARRKGRNSAHRRGKNRFSGYFTPGSLPENPRKIWGFSG